MTGSHEVRGSIPLGSTKSYSAVLPLLSNLFRAGLLHTRKVVQRLPQLRIRSPRPLGYSLEDFLCWWVFQPKTNTPDRLGTNRHRAVGELHIVMRLMISSMR